MRRMRSLLKPSCNARIGFLDIAGTVAQVLDMLGTPSADTLDEVIALDQAARRAATRFAAARAA